MLKHTFYPFLFPLLIQSKLYDSNQPFWPFSHMLHAFDLYRLPNVPTIFIMNYEYRLNMVRKVFLNNACSECVCLLSKKKSPTCLFYRQLPVLPTCAGNESISPLLFLDHACLDFAFSSMCTHCAQSPCAVFCHDCLTWASVYPFLAFHFIYVL